MADFSATLLSLRNAAAQVIYGLNYDGTGVTTARLDVVIDDGIRQFYTPIIRGAGGRPHIYIWSFLHSNTTINAFKALSGTHTTDPGTGTTLTDTAANFKADTNAAGLELIGEVITTTRSSTVTFANTVVTPIPSGSTTLTVSAAFDAAILVTDTYVISLDGNYDLPADFGGLVGRLTFDATTGFPPIQATSTARIREWRQDSRRTQTLRPAYAAVRPRTEGTDATGQRFELMLWPKPDSDYTLHYSYIKIVTDNNDATFFFPGGAFHSQTLISSVRAAAEDTLIHTHPTQRPWRQRFLEQLEASIAFDQAAMTPDTLGISYDSGSVNPTILTGFRSPTTVNGILYP